MVTGKDAYIFLSTPSVWRATGSTRRLSSSRENFYPRPPCGGRRAKGGFHPRPTHFYPRPPCGGRQCALPTTFTSSAFLSTPSVWRATARKQKQPKQPKISIHALRVEGDSMGFLRRVKRMKFLSTPSVWRATVLIRGNNHGLYGFLSTPSVWRATILLAGVPDGHLISIHALRVEGDLRLGPEPGEPPISIHALRVEGDHRRPPPSPSC